MTSVLLWTWSSICFDEQMLAHMMRLNNFITSTNSLSTIKWWWSIFRLCAIDIDWAPLIFHSHDKSSENFSLELSSTRICCNAELSSVSWRQNKRPLKITVNGMWDVNKLKEFRLKFYQKDNFWVEISKLQCLAWKFVMENLECKHRHARKAW